MSAPHGIVRTAALLAIGLGLLGAVLVAALRSPKPPAGGPKAVVDHRSWDLGVIESGQELGHTFVIRNAGQAPLELARGPRLCACTITDLPDAPVPPGGQAEVKMAFTESAKRDELKPGHFSKGVRVLTNDPAEPDILLELTATVNRRVTVAPSPLTLVIDSSKPASPRQRSADALVYSERWQRFELSAANASRKDMSWRVEPAKAEELKDFKALGGCRVVVTMPPDMAEGRIVEWIDFVATPAAGKDSRQQDTPQRTPHAPREERGITRSVMSTIRPPESACRFRLEIQGRVAGRLEFFGPKVVEGNVLRLGLLRQGEPFRGTVLMKVNDPCRRLAVERIEKEPAFLGARVVPYASGSKDAGLYRIEVEIPADAPSCAFLGSHSGVVRIRTDHPRLPAIELRVDFAVASAFLTEN